MRVIFLSKYKVFNLILPSKNHGAAEHHVLSSCGTDSALLTAEASSASLVCIDQSVSELLPLCLAGSQHYQERSCWLGKSWQFPRMMQQEGIELLLPEVL